MPTRNQLDRARQLIENEGESVVYREVQWWYLRKWYVWTRDAVRLLEREGKLVRWSEKTPRLVRLVEEGSDAL